MGCSGAKVEMQCTPELEYISYINSCNRVAGLTNAFNTTILEKGRKDPNYDISWASHLWDRHFGKRSCYLFHIPYGTLICKQASSVICICSVQNRLFWWRM